MGVFDYIFGMRKHIHEYCDLLIVRIDAALEEVNGLLSSRGRFITDEEAANWRMQYNLLLEETGDGMKMRQLRLSPRFGELSQKLRTLQIAANELEQRQNAHNEQIVNERAAAVYSVVGQVEGKQLDRQQLAAIAKDVRTHLVLAGAGTGKTTTVVGLVKYLLKTAQFAPGEILVLSFTNASAAEMKERIRKETEAPVEVSTFHKLGMNIITAVNGIKPKITQLSQHKFIKRQLGILMQNADYLRMVNSYLIHKQYLLKSEFDFTSMQEYRAFLEKNPPVTLKGERVKSYGEVEIANFLYLNGIAYIYEAPYQTDTRTMDYAQYHPDFYLPEYGIYIEYFGIDRNGNPPAFFQNDYVASMNWKRNLHRAQNTVLIETYAYEKQENKLTSALEARLREKGVVLHPVPQEEIWAAITEENKNVLDGLVQLIETVINLMKSNRYDIATMRKRNADLTKSAEVSYLLDIIAPIWDRYNAQLAANDEIDFNDMINRAADYVREGKYRNGFKMVIVDEYQDISRARYELLKALRESLDYRLFCVGDDWQSIYRFAGSDIGYIQRFAQYWGPSEISRIETTYRFPQRLIDITGAFIMQNPMQTRKSIVGRNSDDKYVLGEVEGYTEKLAVQYMLGRFDELPPNSSVFLIGRYSFDIQMLDGNPSLSYRYDNQKGATIVTYSNRRDLMIEFVTAHKSKGLQADYVFILNNKKGKMGFPSKIQDSPVMELLLENSDAFPDAEERRLFYVAMTRAKKKVILITVKDHKSEFAEELIAHFGNEMKQEAFICPQCGGRLRRINGQFGVFYGCENYRTAGCRFKRNVKTMNARE